VDNTLYVAGNLSLAKDMITTVGVGDIRVQTREVINAIETIVEEAGGTLRDIAFNSIFLRNLEAYAGMNEVYGEYFNESPPARYCIRADLATNIRAERMVRDHRRQGQRGLVAARNSETLTVTTAARKNSRQAAGSSTPGYFVASASRSPAMA
jgi:enamine deaminase RidA (YjgF/YER057c/UK114 family)